MARYIAFLRAINVTNRFVKMDVLRGHFESCGFANVETYIQSGNVLFESENSNSDELEALIEETLLDKLGFSVPTFVRTKAEMGAIADIWPFEQPALVSPESFYISFLKSEPAEELGQKMIASSSVVDEFHVIGRQLYWLWHRPRGDTKFTNTKIEKLLGMAATRRNSTTVGKIVKKYFG